MKRLLIGLLIAGGLSSCGSVSWTTLEVDQVYPSQVDLPDQVQRIGLIDRVALTEKDQPGNSLCMNSSQFVQRLGEQIAEADYFEDVILCDSDVSQWERPSVAELYPLTQAHVEDLCEDLGVDMIVSTERCQTDLISSYGMPEVAAEVYLRLYVPQREKPMRLVVIRDTITWDLEEGAELSIKLAREDIMSYMAKKSAEYMAPYWKTVERFYYNDGTVDLRDAASFVAKNDWDKAAEIWTGAMNQAQGKQKAYYAFNLVVYEELRGNMDSAIQKCSELVSSSVAFPEICVVATQYEQVLRKRQKDLQHLSIQMNRFESN